MSNGEYKPDVNEPLTWPRDRWTNTRELRFGECVHGNGMAVCPKCQKRKNPLLIDEDSLDDVVKKVSIEDAFSDLLAGKDDLKDDLPVVLPNGAVMTPAGIEEMNGKQFGGCPNCHRVSCPGAPRFKGICDASDEGDVVIKTKREDTYPVLTGYDDIDEFLNDCLETMRVKGHDYRQGNDADLLHNFRTVAQTVNSDMMKVWFTYFFKHYAAMATFIKEGGQSESEPIEGRIKDQIVYLLLFYRMVQEKKAPVQHHPV